MDTPEVPARDAERAEQEWIAKYRTAIDAAPIEQPLSLKLLAQLTAAYRVIASSVRGVLDRLIRQPLHTRSKHAASSVHKVQASPVRALQTTARRKKNSSLEAGEGAPAPQKAS